MRRRLRRPTIRGRIVALTVLPIIALLTLWSFAMVSVTGDLRALIRLQGIYESFGTPVDTAVGQIQIERRLAAAYLGAGERAGGSADAAAFLAQQRRTDRAVQAMHDAIGDEGRRDGLSARQRQSLDEMADAAARIDGLREQVIERSVSWNQAVDEYTVIVEPTFDVQSTLTALQAGQLAREAQVVVEMVRVREFVSREDALVAGARAAGSLSDSQYDMLTATIEDRRVFHRTYVADLPANSRKLFTDFQQTSEYRALTVGEDALLRAGASGAGKAIAADSWRTTTDRAVKRYMLLCTQSALNAADRGRAFAYREMVKAAVVGGVGLIAVVVSIWLSVSAGRRIARRLEELRDAADVLATRQLPDVMERLSAGEDVDAAAAAPPLDFGDDDQQPDEIAQVGRALNAARRAAVEAAVKQAMLRRGVFAVLLNIARRNQALVHRQAKLVDTLERRTSDPDTLEDLFRIDHLTTRMRRHAEGLIILSGSAPGRRWRRPVPLVDVVAAAVGEIEDYTRVVIPPMPTIGVGAEAVADVVHLIAELVENATAFSPPHTQVTMRTGGARNGFVLEIDDRGLGMDRDELAQAHRTLARPGDFDPVQDERLGLYIVGRLAARHGITVTLTRSPYGGTTAVVLLPNSLTSPVDPGAAPLPADADHEDVPPAPTEVTGAVVHALPTRARQSAPEVPPQRDAPEPAPARSSRAGVTVPVGLRAVGEGSGARTLPAGPDEPAPHADGGPARVLPQRVRPMSVPPGPADGRPASHAEDEPGAKAEHASPGDPSEEPRTSAEGGATSRTLPTRVRRTPSAEPQNDPAGTRPAAEPAGPAGRSPWQAGGGWGVASAPAGVGGGESAPAGERAAAPRAEDRGTPDGGLPSREPAERAGAVAEADSPSARTSEDGAGLHTLPKRVRQASLAVPLRDGPGGTAGEEPSRDVSAEEMRAIFGAFQRGVDRGRRSDPAVGESMSDEGTGRDA
ncbi:nitrate- and nitrite sensing domain-containing protein [Streptomyces sp. NPDC057445]|uniref:sensor histidine kinase n=1 Tax=Streptomyces sp. NPDC057445 TaxID=3346136 RepID=UPI003684ADD6